MPIYEYQCEACGHRSEELQKLSDPPLTVCPACGGAYKKLVSAPAFQFKGSGWYVTDYARKGQGDKKDGAEAKDGAAEKKEGGEKEGGKKESAAAETSTSGAAGDNTDKKTSAASS